MRRYLILLPLAALSACGGTTTETFFCPNGPDFGVTYSETGAVLTLNDGRVEELLPTDDPNTYAGNGIVWQTTTFRTGRLTDGRASYNCDQSSVSRF